MRHWARFLSRQRLARGGSARPACAWRKPLGLAIAACLGLAAPAPAEYADVVINRRSDKEGVRPVVFPHWFHRIRFRCKVCHFELGFKMRAGSNDIRMDDIINGRYCGLCHNGDIAWSADQCDLCHSGKPGLRTGIYGGHETMGPGRW